MKVSDIQDLLSLIRQMLVTAGGNKSAGEIADFAHCLEPFRELTAKQFASELRKLAEGPAKSPRATPKGTKPSQAEADAIVRGIRHLYESAGSLQTSDEDIAAKVGQLSLLSKKDVVKAAEATGLKGMGNKPIAQILSEIMRRVRDRLGAGHRMGTIETGIGTGGDPIAFASR